VIIITAARITISKISHSLPFWYSYEWLHF